MSTAFLPTDVILIIFSSGGLQSVSYILISCLNILIFSSGMKTLELKILMFNGNVDF